MARRKICCETANKLTRQYNHVSNSTADNGEYCCELWISSVVLYCDQCAKWNQTWIFHFYVQCTYSDQIVVMRVEKFLSSQKLEGTMNRKAEEKFIDIWM